MNASSTLLVMFQCYTKDHMNISEYKVQSSYVCRCGTHGSSSSCKVSCLRHASQYGSEPAAVILIPSSTSSLSHGREASGG